VRESSSSFYRRIALPERADADKIDAQLDEGILKVTVPLTPLPEPKKVMISAKNKK
jgi:HSP20 family protein